MRVLVLHGPNLNLLGRREPGLYGAATLASITDDLNLLGAELGVTVEHAQSNHEGVLIDRIQAASGQVEGIVFNPGAYTHSSIAIRDALLAVGIPFVEVHLSNVYAREEFRHRSLLADIAVGKIAGFGASSYTLGLRGLVEHVVASSPALPRPPPFLAAS